ncbi:hypothetical protein D9O50_06890 [Oxalobacteraceae bacterium CAVE-383]|nr:hypothetical protein D9O50_06890 [Oxalobacteraceae bacterium CAVE-383]
MARISGKIEALKDLIVHTGPCIAETQKFQRETNALQSFASNLLSVAVSKRHHVKPQARQSPA